MTSVAQPYRAKITGTRHAAAGGHYLAVLSAFEVLNAGGNAIDAGVAGGLALGIVESLMVGIAGVAPIIIYLADRDEVVTISGVGTFPRAANCELYQREHDGGMPPMLQTVVPAAPDAWITALERFGTMSFGEVAAHAIRFARDGFAMYALMSELIKAQQDTFRRFPSSSAIYLPHGRPPEPGELFRQRDLARVLQYMADEEAAKSRHGRIAGLNAARAAFYRGDIAREMTRYHRENGGLLSADDLANFAVAVEPPAKTSFGDATVHSVGAWGQGPTMLEALNILEGYDLAALGHNSTGYIHRVTEAMKLASADREAYFGDPLFVDVPLDALLSKAHAAQRRALIRADKAWPEMPPAGKITDRRAPTDAHQAAAGGESHCDTSFVCAVDRHGNAFAATPSEGNYNACVIPGLGFVANRRGKGARTNPGHPAALGPGRRPRMTNGPAIAMRGSECFPFGTPGSDNQMQAMLQVFLNAFAFGMAPQEAVEAPRFVTHSFPGTFWPHNYEPGSLFLERRISNDTGAALSALGHKVEWWSEWGPPANHGDIATVSCILLDRATGIMTAGADPRRPGYAVGW